MRLLLLLLMVGCAYDGATFASDNGDLAIPIKLKNLNFTICKKSVMVKFKYTEYHCIELHTENKFILSEREWFNLKHHFVWVSSKEIREHIEQNDFLKEQIQDLFKGQYKTLEFIKPYQVD